MALSKKKSRPITVNETEYRWQFFEGGPNKRWNDVTVQSAEGQGAKLVIQFPWKQAGTPNISLLPPVTPKFVSELIEMALVHGWQPEHPGKSIRMQWYDNKLNEI